jgi:hypothetical protein
MRRNRHEGIEARKAQSGGEGNKGSSGETRQHSFPLSWSPLRAFVPPCLRAYVPRFSPTPPSFPHPAAHHYLPNHSKQFQSAPSIAPAQNEPTTTHALLASSASWRFALPPHTKRAKRSHVPTCLTRPNPPKPARTRHNLTHLPKCKTNPPSPVLALKIRHFLPAAKNKPTEPTQNSELGTPHSSCFMFHGPAAVKPPAS